MAEQQDISRKKLNEVELALIEAGLYTMANAINALMRNGGVPYRKLALPQGG